MHLINLHRHVGEVDAFLGTDLVAGGTSETEVGDIEACGCGVAGKQGTGPGGAARNAAEEFVEVEGEGVVGLFDEWIAHNVGDLGELCHEGPRGGAICQCAEGLKALGGRNGLRVLRKGEDHERKAPIRGGDGVFLLPEINCVRPALWDVEGDIFSRVLHTQYCPNETTQ